MSTRPRPIASVSRLFEELPDNGHLPVRWTKVRCWATKNAYTLIFLSAGFVITWAVQIIVAVIS